MVTKSLFPNKSSVRDGFISEMFQPFIEYLLPIPFMLFQKVKEKRIFPSNFYEANITLIPEVVTSLFSFSVVVKIKKKTNECRYIILNKIVEN